MDQFPSKESRNFIIDILNNESEHVIEFINSNSLSKLPESTKHWLLLATLLRKNKAIAKSLLEHGAPVQKSTSKEDFVNTPLHYAIFPMEDVEITKILLSKGAIVNIHNKNGETPLHLAVRTMRVKLVVTLLEHNADVNVVTKNGGTPLHYLLERYYSTRLNSDRKRVEKIVNILIRHGIDINAKLKDGNAALHMSCSNGCERITKILLNHGAFINVQNDDLYTPLHYAVKYANEDTVKFMIEKGSNLHAQNDKGLTPLTMACSSGRRDIVKVLINYKVDVNYTTANMTTPLHFAIDTGDEEMVALLLKAGANPNTSRRDGKTPYMIAQKMASRNGFEMLHEFLKNCQDVDIDYQDRFGNTALHWACKFKNFIDMNKLLEQGASVNIKNLRGETPFTLSMSFGKEEIEKMKYVHIDKYTTVYDVLMDINTMAFHIKSEPFKKLIDSKKFKNEFPIMSGVVKGQFKRGITRRTLLEEAHYKLTLISGICLPETCSEQIFKSFSDKHLQMFVRENYFNF